MCVSVSHSVCVSKKCEKVSFCVPAWSLTCFVFQTNDAVGFLFNWVFFVPLIGKAASLQSDWVSGLILPDFPVIGSFFMLNLVLGVLSE